MVTANQDDLSHVPDVRRLSRKKRRDGLAHLGRLGRRNLWMSQDYLVMQGEEKDFTDQIFSTRY
jgi:hypothetical protein